MHLTESHCQLVTDEVSSWVARMASRTDRTKATSKDQSLAISVDQCKDLVQWCCQIKWSSLLINISRDKGTVAAGMWWHQLCWPSLHVYLLEHIWLSSCVVYLYGLGLSGVRTAMVTFTLHCMTTGSIIWLLHDILWQTFVLYITLVSQV